MKRILLLLFLFLLYIFFVNLVPGEWHKDCNGFRYGSSLKCPTNGMLPNPLPKNESNRQNAINDILTLINTIDFSK